MAVRAIELGIHTMIEKPVGVFPQDLNALKNSIRQNPEVQTGVLYCRRTNPVFTRIKNMLENKELGKIKRITWIVTDMYRPQIYFDCVSWRGTYSAEGGGLLMNQVSHHIDLLVWLFGLPETIHAHCYTARERVIEVENEVSITMDYPGDAVGQFIASSRECPGTNRLEISGSKGQVILDNERKMTVRMLQEDETEYAVTTRIPFGGIAFEEQEYIYAPAENTELQANSINNFISALTGTGKILCPVADAIRAQQFIQGAYLSSWQERKLKLPADEKTYTEELKKRMRK